VAGGILQAPHTSVIALQQQSVAMHSMDMTMLDITIAGVSAVGTAFALQSHLIFGRPTRIRPLVQGPYQGTYGVTALRLKTPDGAVLEGWCSRPLDGRVDRIVLYFGGRNENVAWVPHMASHNPAAVFYAFNYRSFGSSTGVPSEARSKIDSYSISSFIRHREPELPHLELVYMGRSLGTALALWLSRDIRPHRMVLMSPFPSLPALLSSRHGCSLLIPLLRQHFDCNPLADGFPGKSLVLLAENDTLIPHSASLSLAQRFALPPTVEVIAGTNHKTLPRHLSAQAAISSFLAEA